MPSPLAHLAAGYTLYRVYSDRLPGEQHSQRQTTPLKVLFVAVSVMLPDFDSIIGLLSGNIGRFHNNVTHSLFVGPLAALLVGFLIARQQKERFANWFILALLLYELHVVMDFFTPGRGVMALWPISPARYSAPVPLFYGFHWSDGPYSINHVWTLGTESAFVLILYFLLKWRSKSNGAPALAGRRKRRKEFT